MDFWKEILTYLLRNKGRTLTCGIGISWGIFMLCILVGVGNGLENGILNLFDAYSKNATCVYGGEISVAEQGNFIGQQIRFSDTDLSLLKKSVSNIQYISPECTQLVSMHTNNNIDNFELKGIDIDYLQIKNLRASQGRILNPWDFMQNKNHIIIGQHIAEVLFPKQTAISKYIHINDEVFKVVGIIKNSSTIALESQCAYIPLAAYKRTISNQQVFQVFWYTDQNNNCEKQVKIYLQKYYHINRNDDKALYIQTMEEQTQSFKSLFGGIRGFLWFIGISTLIGGIIGVGNIMHASVKERMRDIGIRKAIGAKSSDIKKMVISESLVITLLAGISGSVIGWMCLRIIGFYLSEESILKDPQIDAATIAVSVVALMLSGLIAGLKPAIYAAALRPIESLKIEN